MNVGDTIRAHRKIRGMTQAELASVLGITQAGVSLIENGARPPTLAAFMRLCTLFGVTAEALWSPAPRQGRRAPRRGSNIKPREQAAQAATGRDVPRN